MEKLDKSSLGIVSRDPDAVIFKEPPLFRPDLTNFAERAQYPDNIYQQTYPEKEKEDKHTFASVNLGICAIPYSD